MNTELTSSPPASNKGRSLSRWSFRAAALMGLAALAVVIILWYQERPLVEAEQVLEQGAPDRALRLANYFLVTHPQHTRALTVKARALVAMGQSPEEVVQIYDQVGAHRVENVHAWARAYLMMQQWTRAEPLLTRVLQLDPTNADALYEMTTCRIRLRRFQEALLSAREFLELSEGSPRGHLLVGSIEYDLGNYDRAAQYFERVIEQEPNAENLQVTPDDMFLQYGRTLMEAGRPQDALYFLGRAVLLNPAADSYSLLGTAARQVGESEKAKEFWRLAVKADPQHITAREALASAATGEGDLEAARQWLEPALDRDDMTTSTAYLLQTIYTRLGDSEAAARWRDKTQQLRVKEARTKAIDEIVVEKPTSFWSRVILAHRFASEGNWEQAEEMATTLLREAEDDPTASSYVTDLMQSVRLRRDPPSLERLPLQQF